VAGELSKVLHDIKVKVPVRLEDIQRHALPVEAGAKPDPVDSTAKGAAAGPGPSRQALLEAIRISSSRKVEKPEDVFASRCAPSAAT
jgi:ABC-type uncharacterized transport system involved in gliding motility auxiliary subunit